MNGFAPEWSVSPAPVDYRDAIAAMESRVESVLAGQKPEWIWLLQHPPLYTAGTSADPSELIDPQRFPVYATGRGGKYTYHGPGQRTVYAVIDLRARGKDVHAHVERLEAWVIRVLNDFGVTGERRAGRVGIWVERNGVEEKIAAIGVRVRKWVAYHGLALNVDPDLSHFSGIVPCGLPDFGVTSLRKLGIGATMQEIDEALRRHNPFAA